MKKIRNYHKEIMQECVEKLLLEFPGLTLKQFLETTARICSDGYPEGVREPVRIPEESSERIAVEPTRGRILEELFESLIDFLETS